MLQELGSNINFREWLVSFLSNVHDYDLDYGKDLAELLPHNVKGKTKDVSEIGSWNSHSSMNI